jgi:hypothetical protein
LAGCRLVTGISIYYRAKAWPIQLLKNVPLDLQTRRKAQADYKREKFANVGLDLHSVYSLVSD